jgi:DNA-binding NarL/FixJ family response regulator
MEPSDVRIALADDHRIVLEALELSLSRAGFQVVGTALTSQAALDVCLRHSPDVLLTDLLMPDGDGLKTARKVRARVPGCKIIILTSSRLPWHIARAKRAGVDGYLSKSPTIGDLERTILDVAQGQRVFDPDLILEVTGVHGTGKPFDGMPVERRPIEPLTDQEIRVLKLITAGLSNAEIASLLDLSPHTIKAHIRHIFSKLDVSDRTTAAITAFRTGMVSIEELFASVPLSEG